MTSAFVRDLTLNLGLTWEYTSPWVEKDDRQSNIDLRTGQLLLAGQNGNSRALYDAYYGGWEPRVGFAWTPSDKWVVRGAYGIVQYMEGTGKNLRLPANPPFNFEGQRAFDLTTGSGTASIGFGDIVSNVTGGPGTLFRIFAPDLRPQLTKQWNVFVERKLTNSLSGQIGYVGSRSSHMVVPFDFNQPEADSGPVSTWRPLAQRRPLYALNPNLDTQTSGTNSIGVGAYDALQASLRQRPSDGLEFLASYTYGKALSDNVGYYGVGWGQTAGQGYYYLDSTDPLRDYGPSPYDMRHVFSVAANYELPFGKERKYGSDWGAAKNLALGGWNLNTIFQAHTGLPITVYDGAGQSLQATRSLERPNRVCNGKISGAGVDDAWIDIACFQHAPAGQFGDSGVGILRGPGYWNVDFGLAKNFYHRRHALPDVPNRGVQCVQSPELRVAGGFGRHVEPHDVRPDPEHVLSAADRGAGREVHVLDSAVVFGRLIAASSLCALLAAALPAELVSQAGRPAPSPKTFRYHPKQRIPPSLEAVQKHLVSGQRRVP